LKSKNIKRREKRRFIGLKKHTHAQRAKLLRNIVVPMLRKELGANLIAIAADGSHARQEDTGYSDLELMVFVKENTDLPRGFSKIYDGMLVEGLFITEDQYHQSIHEPNEEWFIAGSDRLLPITNQSFIHRLQLYEVKNLAKKCDKCTENLRYEIQESFGKLFNAIDHANRDNLFPILSETIMNTLKLLAYINRKPYTSMNSFITEAKRLKKKPNGFDDFFRLTIKGEYQDLAALERCAIKVFTGIEDLLGQSRHGNLYDNDLSTIYPKQTTKKRR
jgi:hypothetical protein